MKNWFNYNLLKIVVILMIIGALLSSLGKFFVLPFAYYQLLNWFVAGAALIIIWQARQRKIFWLIWIFSLVAVVFNPLAPIYLSSLAWQIVDFVALVLFALSFFWLAENKIKE